MKIQINGAARTVTGSQYLISANGRQLLLDCGMFQGRRDESYARNRSFHVDVRKLDAVILSHAHIDHSGNLPNLVKNGYRNPIYTTPPTADLADVMLRDSGHIQEADVAFVNKKRLRQGLPPMEPLYTSLDAERVRPLFSPVNYNQSFQPIPGVTARLVDAGHILGSAAIVLDIEERGRKVRFWFSGDIGREKLPLMRDPVLPDAPDYLMMECTYGDKPHRDPELAFAEFRQVVKETFERGGKVIIPAFAVGRTQELVYDLNQMITHGDLPHVPVYVDSPLAVETSRIFQLYPEYFDQETREFVMSHKHPALNYKDLHYVQSVEESKRLNDRSNPMIIISASGMAETGRILHHLRNNIENSRNTICIVSWQAPYTLGRRLADGDKRVNIFGEEFEVHARVATIGGLSAHAGQDMLLKYAKAAKGGLKKLILIHGEEKSESAFAEQLLRAKIGPVVYPEQYEEIEL